MKSLRLGEDYDFYARALLEGARYKIVHGCGYGSRRSPGFAERQAQDPGSQASL